MKNCQLSFHSVARNTRIAEPRGGSTRNRKKGKEPIGKRKYIERGYYTVARGYEVYFRLAKQYFTNEILFWSRENKIHIFKLPCTVLFII